MYHFILFDLDGTLTDSKEGIVKSAVYAFEKLHWPVPDAETMTKFVGPPLRYSFTTYGGMDDEMAEQAVEAFRERYHVKGMYENAAVPGCPELLRRLKEKGYVMALASSKLQMLCDQIVERYGYAPSLDLVAGSNDDANETKASVIQRVLDHFGITEENKSSVLMVGDRRFDVEGALDRGIDCVGVEYCGYADPGELEAAGAVAVVKTVEELEQFILNH